MTDIIPQDPLEGADGVWEAEREAQDEAEAAEKQKPKNVRPKILLASEIEPLPVYWLWVPYVPMGMLTLVSGDPDMGKSWMTMSLAADMSAGRPLPLMRVALPPRNVLILNYEDSKAHTMVPRLISLGADLDRIFIPDTSFVLDNAHTEWLHDFINAQKIGTVFIDPMVAALGGGVDMNKANEVRAFTAPLANVAEKTGAAIIGLRHLRKSGRGDQGKAIYAGLGSIDWTAAVRSELFVERAKDGTRVVRHIKCNVAPLGPTLAYQFSDYETTDARGEPVTASRFEWQGLYEGELPEIVEAVREKPNEKAKEWLRDHLAEGPKRPCEVKDAAKVAGIAPRTLDRVKDAVVERAPVDGVIFWKLKPGGELRAAA